MQVSLAHLDDERSLRAAMAGVDTVIHLVGAEWRGPEADMLVVDAGGTRRIAEAAAAAGVRKPNRPLRMAGARAAITTQHWTASSAT